MKYEPFNGYKGKLYKMLNGISEAFLREETNKVIAKQQNISIEAAKKKRTVTFRETAIILEKFVGSGAIE